MPLSSIPDALAAFKRGDIIVVIDDEDRENEGDLIMAAEHATPEKIAFFVKHTSGLICAPIEAARADELNLPLMVPVNTESMRTAFTITIDYRHGTSTGISASDRSATIQSLVDPRTRPGDLARPGHIAPLIARAGGVLNRAGHTEAAVDLARMAGLFPAGVLCELVTEDGSEMQRLPDLELFAAQHGLLLISIADLIRHRRQTEKLVTRQAEARIPTQWGDFTFIPFKSIIDGETHLAFVKGDVTGEQDVLVRVHSECLTGDIFGSRRCDCGEQLHGAMQLVADEGRGVVVYLRGHEGRGIGIAHKLAAYGLQDQGMDTIEANEALGLPVDSREYGIGAQILHDLGITTMRLMTNNPAKRGGLEGYGLKVVDRISLRSTPNPENIAYLRTKADRMGHLIDGLDGANHASDGSCGEDAPATASEEGDA